MESDIPQHHKVKSTYSKSNENMIPTTEETSHWRHRSSHQRCSLRKVILKNFAKFTGKHLYQGLFFNKVAGRNFIKKEILVQVFSCEFCEIFK